MVDITPSLNELLINRDAQRVGATEYSLDRVSEFLKEAHQINSRVSELLTYLRSICRAYLSTAPPPRQSRFAKAPVKHGRNASRHTHAQDEVQYLTNGQRDSIDAAAKTTWRDINAAITQLSDAEKTRQATEDALIKQKRRKKGFGSLGRWAAGGVETEKSVEERDEDERVKGIAGCRESVIWYLQRGLEECGRTQSSMMEVRINREVERGKSVLAEAKGRYAGASATTSVVGGGMSSTPAMEEQTYNAAMEPELSAEQQQLFAEENKNMLKLYEDRAAQVREVEKSLIEISELQNTLAINLDQQSEHVTQLVQDSFQAAEDVGRGNMQLKKASERRSTAKLVFYASVALSGFLVVWDLII